MKLFRPRFTVRRLMIAVAMAAVLMGVWIWGERRRHRFRELASWHGGEAVNYSYFGLSFSRSQIPAYNAFLAKNAGRINYHKAMSKKYTRAYHYPWLPVPPDPPEPD